MTKNEKYLTERRHFTKEEKEIVMAKTACKCGRCGKKMTFNEATIDHIIPMDKGGLNDEYNCIALCEDCNRTKSNFMYNIEDYYKYILPDYFNSYYIYHNYAMEEMDSTYLFNHHEEAFTIWSEQQKMIIANMIKRKAKKKNINAIAEKMGTKVILQRAYEGDADEIMQLINKCIGNKHVSVNESYYKNNYMVKNDIQDGEVYVLRTLNEKKICGAFLFKHINDETLPFIQLQNILMETKFHVQYIMTGAFVDAFASDIYNNVMETICRRFISKRIVPVYFDILAHSFVDSKECIIIPHEIDGIKGNVEFMPLKYIRKMVGELVNDVLHGTHATLDDNEKDIFIDIMLNHRNVSELKEISDEEKEIIKKYPDLQYLFRPDNCELYKKGFKRKEE